MEVEDLADEGWVYFCGRYGKIPITFKSFLAR
jgi:hypothetical protein